MADLGSYFDLQVNGCGGVDFNSDSLSAESLHDACDKLQAGGVSGILATIISADLGAMETRLRALVKLRNQHPLIHQIIAGIHIEGPFINEKDGYRGAHPAGAIRPANPDAMKRLLEAAGGLTRIVTLAPERDPDFQVTRLLASEGVVVSAGHTDASMDELKGAIDCGLSMFTHVGNGCPMVMHRHDNIIQRALSLAERLWLTFIADGAHVPWPALGNYLKVAGVENSVVVTDAIAAAGLGPGRYTLGHWDLLIGDDMVARAPDGSHLVGSAGTMERSARNLIKHVGLKEADIRTLMIGNPRAAIGL